MCIYIYIYIYLSRQVINATRGNMLLPPRAPLLLLLLAIAVAVASSSSSSSSPSPPSVCTGHKLAYKNMACCGDANVSATCVAPGAAAAAATAAVPEVDPEYEAACPNSTCSTVSALCRYTLPGDTIFAKWYYNSSIFQIDIILVAGVRLSHPRGCHLITTEQYIQLEMLNDTTTRTIIFDRMQMSLSSNSSVIYNATRYNEPIVQTNGRRLLGSGVHVPGVTVHNKRGTQSINPWNVIYHKVENIPGAIKNHYDNYNSSHVPSVCKQGTGAFGGPLPKNTCPISHG